MFTKKPLNMSAEMWVLIKKQQKVKKDSAAWSELELEMQRLDHTECDEAESRLEQSELSYEPWGSNA